MGVDERQIVVGDDAGRLTWFDFTDPPNWSPNAVAYYADR